MTTNSKFKHFFPEINKFLFCLDLEVGVKISSIIMASLVTLAAINLVIHHSLLVLIDVPVLVSFIFLIIGLFKNDLYFLKQFKIMYIGYLIIQLIAYFLAIIMSINILIGRDPNAKCIFDYVSLKHIYEIPYNKVELYIIKKLIIYPILIFIGYLVELYYYNIIGSYIEKVENTMNEQHQARKLEENNNNNNINNIIHSIRNFSNNQFMNHNGNNGVN